MNKLLRMAVLAIAFGVFAVPAVAAETKAATDPVVAKVNGKSIMRSDVMREMSQMGPAAAQMPPQMLFAQALDRLVTMHVISAAGYADKIQNTAEAKERVQRAEQQIVSDIYLRKKIEPMITDEKVKARYDELAKKFKPEDEVRARHILVATEDEAKKIIDQLEDGADFAKLAAEKSKDAGSAKEGGDLGYFPKEAMVKPFSDAAFAMKTGEMSEKPVKTDFGWHVIKVMDKRKSSPPPLEAVRNQIESDVGNSMVGPLVKDMVAKAKIERFAPDGSPLPPPGASAKADKPKAKAE